MNKITHPTRPKRELFPIATMISTRLRLFRTTVLSVVSSPDCLSSIFSSHLSFYLHTIHFGTNIHHFCKSPQERHPYTDPLLPLVFRLLLLFACYEERPKGPSRLLGGSRKG